MGFIAVFGALPASQTYGIFLDLPLLALSLSVALFGLVAKIFPILA